MNRPAAPSSRRTFSLVCATLLSSLAGAAFAQNAPATKATAAPAKGPAAPAKAAEPKPLAGQVVRMVRIDPLSGLLGPVGINQSKSYQFFAEKYSAINPAGVKFEVSFIDNKLSPTESLNALKSALDQGIRYIVQGNGSSVALALIDAINKHNERNPGKEVIYLNDSAVDPDLTNSKCSYWHFRFDADTSMKIEAMTTFITGNWGSDLSLLVKAANEGGYNGKFYTYYTGVTGTPTALGTNGAGRVFQIAYSHYNMGGQMAAWSKEFNEKYNDDHYTHSVNRIFEALGAAMAKAKSTDPVKVAAALEGLRFNSFNGEVEMRKVDHQLQQPLYMTVWQKADAKFPYSPEKTGMTLVPVKEFPNYVSSTPTSCQMKRP